MDYWQEPDGTWTFHDSNWHSKPITGLHSEAVAIAIEETMREAMIAAAYKARVEG